MKKKKKIIIWIILIGIIVFIVYRVTTNKKEITTYTTENVSRGNLAQTVSATGRIVSSEQADLSFMSAGRADSVLVDVGDKVAKGQKLATIDRSTFPQQLRQAQLEIQVQKEVLKNMKRDSNDDAYSKNQRNAQEAVIKKAESAYEGILRQMRDNALYAPIGGTIIKKNINVGEVVTSGEIVFVIANPNDLFIESNIPEVDIVDISSGQKVLLTFDALAEDEVFSGNVTDVDPASTLIQEVVFYRIKIRMDSFDSRLKLGMSCNDDIVIANAENILMIPQRAVKKENGKKYVEILKEGKDGQETEKVYVETGISGDNGMIEVKNNLKEGEKVITFTKVK
jgi:macrolide-specific efflux system membrane fusion protein